MIASTGKCAVLSLVLIWVGCGGGDEINTTPDPGPPPECLSMSQCDDGDPCTIPSCVGGKCEFTLRNCDDNNLCTDDVCVGGNCVYEHKPLCCLEPADCDDKNPCTTDTCYSYACQYDVPDPACCTKASQCDDGNDCTLDDCFNNKCTYTVLVGGDCCGKDLDCHDSNPCTDDFCQDGKCMWVNTGCCQIDEDCVDDDPCTKDGTCNDKGACEYTEVPGCCADDQECDDGNACTSDVCVSLYCEHAAVGACCTGDPDCQVTDPCKVGTCVIPVGSDKGECVITLVSSPECCTTSVLTVDFDDGSLGGFTVSALYGAGPGWVVDSHRAASPPSSLYFGDPAAHTYDVDVQTPVGGKAVFAELDLTKTLEPELRFQLWKETELVASSDVLSVVVILDGQESTVWSSAQYPQFANTAGAFVPVNVSLAFYTGDTVAVAFVFDTVNGFANTYEGVYLDDIQVVGKCQ
ncbi:MAG: hypothetical protein ISR64_00485 [Deltaproteobacteria bacterium]|nr:hypothetical protein [Deltaproteobacteria bacterium]